MWSDALQRRLEASASLESKTLRKMLPIGLLTAALEDEGVIPIVYGGAAVEWYLEGSHDAGDIDLLCTNPERLKALLRDIGFHTAEGEFFTHPVLPVPIQLQADEDVVVDERHGKVLVDGYPVYMITVAQCVLDYLHKFIEGPTNLEPVFVADLLEQYKADLDVDELLERARDYGSSHLHALRAIVALRLHQITPP
jgi:hypothetical protein